MEGRQRMLLTVHGLANASEQAVDVGVNLVDDHISVAVLY